MAGLRRLTVVALALVLVSFTVGQVESKRTFLNGLNQAWVNYGMDFGNNPSPSDLQTLTKTLEIVAQSGGNAVRIWVHCGAEYTPKFNSSGYVSATDNAGTLIPDMANYLSAAQRYNVSVFFVLWNAAVPMTKELVGLLTVQSKLQSYIDVVLTPMISTLKHYSSLGGIEIMNEPEGSFLVQYNSNKCLNTQFMGNWGAGWSGQNFNVQLFQKFINLQAGAIHRAGNVSVTVGSYSEVAQTNQFGYTNFYTDQCLQEAGGDPLGTLDYNQIHCYDWEGAYSPTAPFLHTASQYQTPKPLIVGEFSQAGGAGWTSQQQYSYLFQNGYAGAWGWQATGGGYNSDDLSILSKGIQAAAKLNQ